MSEDETLELDQSEDSENGILSALALQGLTDRPSEGN